MSKTISSPHAVSTRRLALGWSQEELARRSGLPRSSVSAIEAARLTPSVAAALAVARALECSVEELFADRSPETGSAPAWAWTPHGKPSRYWEAEVGSRRLLFPIESTPGNALPHDGVERGGVLHGRGEEIARKTLVLAGCDPAAGLLAGEYAAASGFRLLSFSRGGAAALELLARGAVHVAALHRSTEFHPERNAATVRERLGDGYRLVRCADWTEGIALPSTDSTKTVRGCTKRIRRWAPREPGSSARECLDELLGHRHLSQRPLLSHSSVAEIVRSGWADAGVCVQLSAADAGLNFLPVRTEFLDLCFPATLERDPRLQALLRLLRSRAYRRLIDELPGYSAAHTGELTAA